MTDQSIGKVVRGIFTLGLSSLVRIITGFLTTAIGARMVSETELGVYFLAFALVALLEVFGNMGLRISSAKFIAGTPNRDEQAVFVNNILTIRLVTLVLVALLAIIGKPLFLLLFPSDLLSKLYYFVPVLFILQLSESTLSFVMQGFQLYRKMAIIEVILGVLNLGLVLILLVWMRLGIDGLVYASLIYLSVGIVLRFLMIPTKIRLVFDRQIFKKIFNFGFPLTINDALSYLIDQVDTLLVASLLNPASIAYLGIARKIPGSLRKLVTSINSVYFPHLNHLIGQNQKEETERFLNNFLRLAAAGTLFVAFESIVFQEEIITLIFSDKYLYSAPAFGMFMLILSISTISQILDSGYLAAGFPAYVLIVNVTVAVFGIGGNLAMIPIYGFIGSAIARLAAEAIGNTVSFWALRKSKIDAQVNTYLKPLLIMMACLAIYYFTGIKTLMFKGILAVLFPTLLFVFSVVTFREIRKIFDVLVKSRKARSV